MQYARIECMQSQGKYKYNLGFLKQGCHNSPLYLKNLSSKFSYLYYGTSEDNPVSSSLQFPR